MRFVATAIAGAFLIEQERHADERGHFARTYCAREFADHGLNPAIAQVSVSYNHLRGTLRGMHWQAAAAAETKLVRPTRGAIHDVIVDLRPGSPTYLACVASELSAEGGAALYVPEMCAHGFQTLADSTEVEYQISEFHAPDAARGFRYDDPALGIRWPLPVAAINSRDREWPAFRAALPAVAAP